MASLLNDTVLPLMMAIFYHWIEYGFKQIYKTKNLLYSFSMELKTLQLSGLSTHQTKHGLSFSQRKAMMFSLETIEETWILEDMSH